MIGREPLDEIQRAIMADLADDDYGLWEVFGIVKGELLPDVTDAEVESRATSAVGDFLKRGFVQIRTERPGQESIVLESPVAEEAIRTSSSWDEPSPNSDQFWLVSTEEGLTAYLGPRPRGWRQLPLVLAALLRENRWRARLPRRR
ncbi:MAG: hypothetical protein M3540_01805 [Actinomycetota bacterium]|nr:hypothetical protein [Actinomycetota bacterium]